MNSNYTIGGDFGIRNIRNRNIKLMLAISITCFFIAFIASFTIGNLIKRFDKHIKEEIDINKDNQRAGRIIL